MGILNITPDSFSDGGEFFQLERALEHADNMISDGVDIIDIGGESTRPGAANVSESEEIDRVIPVIEGITRSHDLPISIDTSKAVVARAAMEAGAHIINDIGALRLDDEIAEVAAETGAGLVLMHMKGLPRTMQLDPCYEELMGEITDYLASSVGQALDAGISRSSLVVDPGFGFGKTMDNNWEILAQLCTLRALEVPILVGISRKRFLQERVGTERQDLEAATLAADVVACLNGAQIVRVHDVRSHRCAMEVVSKLSSV